MTTAHLSLAIGDTPPSEFRIFRAGRNDTIKGEFTFDDASAKSVMSEYRAHGADIMIDYGHSSLDVAPIDPSQAGKAAAWCGLEIRSGELWAVRVRWTKPASAALANREWRYMSPAFSHKDGHIETLMNIAITNLPATRQLQPLMAASAKNQETKTMSKILTAEKILAASDEDLVAFAKSLKPRELTEALYAVRDNEAAVARLRAAAHAAALGVPMVEPAKLAAKSPYDTPTLPKKKLTPEQIAIAKEYGLDEAGLEKFAHDLAVQEERAARRKKGTKLDALASLRTEENPPTDAQLVACLSAEDRALCKETGCTDLAFFARVKFAGIAQQARVEEAKSASLAAARANVRASVAAMRGRQ